MQDCCAMFVESWLFLQILWISFESAESYLYNSSLVKQIWPKLRNDRAIAVCEHVQSQLADPYSLQEFLEYQGKPTGPLWIAIKRYHFMEIRTTDGDIFEFPDHQIKEVPGVDCGVYHSQDQLFDEKPCNMDTDGYICEYKGYKQCPQGAYCMTYTQDRLLAFIPFKSSWFTAHDRCRKDGGRLVNLTPHMAEKIKAFTKGSSDIKSHYLTGLIRSGWNISVSVYKDKGQRTNHILESYQWDKDQPDPGEDKNCAVLQYKNRYVWEAVSCDGEYGFICLPLPIFDKTTGITREIRSEVHTEKPRLARNASYGCNSSESVSSRQFLAPPTSDVAVISITLCTLVIVIISLVVQLVTYMSTCRGNCSKPSTQPPSKQNEEKKALLDPAPQGVSEDIEQNASLEKGRVTDDTENFQQDTHRDSNILSADEKTNHQETAASITSNSAYYQAGSSEHTRVF